LTSSHSLIVLGSESKLFCDTNDVNYDNPLRQTVLCIFEFNRDKPNMRTPNALLKVEEIRFIDKKAFKFSFVEQQLVVKVESTQIKQLDLDI